MNHNSSFAEMTSDELEHATGGAHARHAQPPASHGGGLFGWLDSIYKNIVFSVGSHVGGGKLAEKMYGKHVTASDRSRSEAAMKKFLVAGHKLPQGVPNIFG